MKKRQTGNIVFTFLIVIMLALIFVSVLSKKGDEPANPIEGTAVSYSDMYVLEGDELALSEEAVTALKENRQKGQNQQTGPESDAQSEAKDEGSKKGNKKDASTKEGSGRGTSANDNTNMASADKKPGKEQKTENENPTDDVYFTTSIRDGEIVTAHEYAFTITHLHEELDVEKVSVLVNSEESPDFAGKVFLQEGSNTITVAVVYSDSYGKKIQAEKSYRVIVDTQTLVISTDLKDCEVDSPYFDFTASAKYKETEVPLEVTLNGDEAQGEEGTYSVTLKQGKNLLHLKAQKGDLTVEKTYTVTFTSKTEYSIYTTLKDQTVNEEAFSFRALIVNGTAKAKLTVVVNGTTVAGDNGKYQTTLKIGNNTIRLKATDTGAVSINETYTIKYVPLATEETEPVLKYINVSDGMEINGETFTLNIGAEDYKGNKIYYDGIRVKLNDKKLQYVGSGDYVRYKLKLQSGENQLDVRLTDSEGRYKDFHYTLKCTYIEPGTPVGTATVVMDAKVLHLGTLMSKKVEILYGDTAASVVARALEDDGFSYESSGSLESGFYLAAVKRSGITRGWKIDDGLLEEIEEDGLTLNRDGDTDELIHSKNSLGQFDFCQGSGWMYMINGKNVSYGMSEYEPEDGDTISLRYTLAYGKDIGAYQSSSGSHGIKDSYEHTY